MSVIVLPPSQRRWVIIKAGEPYTGGGGYDGPACDQADIPGRQVYFSKKSAHNDCFRLNRTGGRFIVTQYRSHEMDKGEFLTRLKEYHDRWLDQRKDYVVGLMGHAASNGINDFLNFIAPDKFKAKKDDPKLDERIVTADKIDLRVEKEAQLVNGHADFPKEIKIDFGKPPESDFRPKAQYTDWSVSLKSDNIIKLKGKGTVILIKPTDTQTTEFLLSLPGRKILVNDQRYRVVSAELSERPKTDVGLICTEA